MPIANGPVYAIAVDGNSTYIGGDFYYVGPYTGSGVKLTVSSAAYNKSFPVVNGTIKTAVTDGSGGWYIGGRFTQVGGFTRNNIARINSDGSVSPWNPGADNIVYSIAVNGSDVFVGGSFSS
ncbi:MAG: delta-60 repeat domain-containing protein, partial [Syntrophothermus sp.]